MGTLQDALVRKGFIDADQARHKEQMKSRAERRKALEPVKAEPLAPTVEGKKLYEVRVTRRVFVAAESEAAVKAVLALAAEAKTAESVVLNQVPTNDMSRTMFIAHGDVLVPVTVK